MEKAFSSDTTSVSFTEAICFVLRMLFVQMRRRKRKSTSTSGKSKFCTLSIVYIVILCLLFRVIQDIADHIIVHKRFFIKKMLIKKRNRKKQLGPTEI